MDTSASTKANPVVLLIVQARSAWLSRESRPRAPLAPHVLRVFHLTRYETVRERSLGRLRDGWTAVSQTQLLRAVPVAPAGSATSAAAGRSAYRFACTTGPFQPPSPEVYFGAAEISHWSANDFVVLYIFFSPYQDVRSSYDVSCSGSFQSSRPTTAVPDCRGLPRWAALSATCVKLFAG
jgi:hypothetical protein